MRVKLVDIFVFLFESLLHQWMKGRYILETRISKRDTTSPSFDKSTKYEAEVSFIYRLLNSLIFSQKKLTQDINPYSETSSAAAWAADAAAALAASSFFFWAGVLTYLT